MNSQPPVQARFRRGDTSAERPGLVFIRYNRGREIWGSSEKLDGYRANARAIDKRWKTSPVGREYMRDYLREYSRLPKQKERRSEYFLRTKEQTRLARNEYARKWQKTEKAKQALHPRRREYVKRIRATPEGKLHHNYSGRISKVFRNLNKNVQRGRTVAMLGCDFAFFRGWIEAKFQHGMTWDNYGGNPGQWQVDHQAPLRSFDITDPAQAAKAFHYTNCAPMWAHENMAKSDFIEINGKRIRARDINKTIIPFKEQAA